MLAPTNKYSKGSKKVKNSRKNVTKKIRLPLMFRTILWVITPTLWGNSLGK